MVRGELETDRGRVCVIRCGVVVRRERLLYLNKESSHHELWTSCLLCVCVGYCMDLIQDDEKGNT